MNTLELTLPAEDPAVFNIDLYSMDVEHSLLLEPLRKLPEFGNWLQRHRKQRQSMLQRMSQMEARGEIMSAEVARTNLGN